MFIKSNLFNNSQCLNTKYSRRNKNWMVKRKRIKNEKKWSVCIYCLFLFLTSPCMSRANNQGTETTHALRSAATLQEMPNRSLFRYRQRLQIAAKCASAGVFASKKAEIDWRRQQHTNPSLWIMPKRSHRIVCRQRPVADFLLCVCPTHSTAKFDFHLVSIVWTMGWLIFQFVSRYSSWRGHRQLGRWTNVLRSSKLLCCYCPIEVWFTEWIGLLNKQFQ